MPVQLTLVCRLAVCWWEPVPDLVPLPGQAACGAKVHLGHIADLWVIYSSTSKYFRGCETGYRGSTSSVVKVIGALWKPGGLSWPASTFSEVANG